MKLMSGASWLSHKHSSHCCEEPKVRLSLGLLTWLPLTFSTGTVVNQASVAGIQGYNLPFSGIYSSSKAAIYSMSDSMRVEFAPFEVKVRVLIVANKPR